MLISIIFTSSPQALLTVLKYMYMYFVILFTSMQGDKLLILYF